MIKALALAGIAAALATPAFIPPAHQDQWSCVDDGNRVCSPENNEGKQAGCYDDGGVLFAPWPCEAWQPSFGWHHADGTTTYPNDSYGIGSGCIDGTVPVPAGKTFQCVDPQDPDIDPDIPDAIVDAGRHHGHGHRRR
jgi:hypothetical protein